MFKQSPTSRNYRSKDSKGIKTKHVLQICLLLAVCFWLIYQVKRSYDKGKEFDENDSGFSLKTGSIHDGTKWGRKSLLPRSKEISITSVKQDKQVVVDRLEEDEDNKPEEVEQDQDNKFEEENDEDRGGGDDAVDEHDQEKSDEDVDQEDELVDDEKETGEVDETDMKISEENNDHVEEENSQDHELDEDSMSTHEAQEELYKADDASSAVTHDTQMVSTENENSGLEDTNENAGAKNHEDDHETNRSLITTGHDESIHEHVSSNSKITSFLNLTSPVESNSHLEDLTEVSSETHDVSPPHLTQSSSNSTIGGNVTVNVTAGGEQSLAATSMQQGSTSVQIVKNNRSDSNLAPTKNEGSSSTPANFSSGSTPTHSLSNNTTNEHQTFDGAGDKSDSSAIETSNEVESEKSEIAGETGQDLIDPSDTSIPLEDKELVMDLETLPEIQTKGSNTEDAAAE